MCRNITPLFNFDPPASHEEVRAASLQYVRKISGMNQPSAQNNDVFIAAVDAVSAATQQLLDALNTTAPAKNRDEEASKRRTRAAKRFA